MGVQGYFMDLEDAVDEGRMCRKEAEEIKQRRLRNASRRKQWSTSKEERRQKKRDKWLYE